MAAPSRTDLILEIVLAVIALVVITGLWQWNVGPIRARVDELDHLVQERRQKRDSLRSEWDALPEYIPPAINPPPFEN